MNHLLGHCLILLGAGAAACAASLAIEHPEYAGADAAVVVAHTSPAPVATAGEGERAPAPQSRDALVRLIEHELARVGCYDGAIGSSWGSEPQAAMRAFLSRVNARLPVAQPDEILLRLVQGEKQRVCAEPCRAEPAANAHAACLASVLTAEPAPVAAVPEQSPGRSVAAAAPAPPALAQQPAPGAAVADDARQGAAPPSVPAGKQTEAALAPESPTTPAHHTPARRAPKSFSGKRPPKLVRLLLRNLQRFAQFP